MNDITKRNAVNMGLPWDDDDVSTLASLIERDSTTFDMAMERGAVSIRPRRRGRTSVSP
jgi:hypothetical protein